MRKHVVVFVGVAFLSLALLVPMGAASASRARSAALHRQRAVPGPLPRDAKLYASLKQAANAKAAHARVAPRTTSGQTVRSPHQPSAFITWDGIPNDGTLSPSDSNGSIGPDRYIELINGTSAFGGTVGYNVYDRTSASLSNGTLNDFAGVASTDFVFDPQVGWDALTGRFYYVMDDITNAGSGTNELAFGWSMTSSPSSAANFCHFTFAYPGNQFPDYPKLGWSQKWGLVGVNVFTSSSGTYVESDVFYFMKPPAGSTCPNSATTGVKTNLLNQDGTQAFTPVPARSTEPNTALSDGIIVANNPYGAGTQNYITQFTVFPTPAAPFIYPGKAITIAPFAFPPSADQPGLPASISTLDGRLTNAYLSRDPRLGKLAVWTQQTVANATGTESEVRWYELDSLGLTVLQNGAATDPTGDAYNGAISPDRANNGTTRAFGANMILGFTTSSLTAFTADQMLSKVGAAPQSGFVLIQQSPGLDVDFTCCPNRWGDYSGASPDPAAPQNGASGMVWLTNMWNDATCNGTNVCWRTWNWGATP
jgi:hypothetical protein